MAKIPLVGTTRAGTVWATSMPWRRPGASSGVSAEHGGKPHVLRRASAERRGLVLEAVQGPISRPAAVRSQAMALFAPLGERRPLRPIASDTRQTSCALPPRRPVRPAPRSSRAVLAVRRRPAAGRPLAFRHGEKEDAHPVQARSKGDSVMSPGAELRSMAWSELPPGEIPAGVLPRSRRTCLSAVWPVP